MSRFGSIHLPGTNMFATEKQRSRPLRVDKILGNVASSSAAEKTTPASIRRAHLITERHQYCCPLSAGSPANDLYIVLIVS